MKNRKTDEKNKLTFMERLKDKRERAKIELIAYGIFFVGVIIFTRILGSTSNNIENNNIEEQSFINKIEDNYEYDIQITINDKIYQYYGKVLGNNSTINLIAEDKQNSYYSMNKKYYVLEEENYILTDEEEVYPYIDYRYLNIKNIKEYINIATKENNTYKIKVKDIIITTESEEYFTINVEEGDKNIIIDYTPLLKIINKNIEKIVVNITFSNIDNIISLEE